MNKIGLDLFVELYFEKNSYRVIQFLVEQYELIIEFDSDNMNSNNNEDEFELVFDRGVESVQNVNFYFMIDICNLLKTLVSKTTDQYINNYLNDKYRNIIDILNKDELKNAFDNLKKMQFNDVRFTKITCSLKFLKCLNQYVNRENKLNFAKLISDITKNDQYLNCFINFYLN